MSAFPLASHSHRSYKYRRRRTIAMTMNRSSVTIAATVALVTASSVGTAAETAPAKKPAASTSLNALDRGKYMLIVGGCNDCHTADFAARSGDVPEREWLKGSGKVGFSGPWGTT